MTVRVWRLVFEFDSFRDTLGMGGVHIRWLARAAA